MKRQILRHLPTLIGAGVLVASATICTSAYAQWLPDRKYQEGSGIRIGESLEFHPGIALRAGFDNNVFREDSNLQSSGMLAITPHLNLSTVGPQRRAGEGEGARVEGPPKLVLNSGASVSYFYYFQDAPPRGIEADVNGSLTLFPERPVHGTFELGYGRTIRAFSQPGAAGVPNYDTNTITPGALLGFSSRGGIFNASVGYRPTIIIYGKDENGNDFSYLNVWRSSIPVSFAWKFLPHTGLIHETEIGYQKYLDDTGSNVAVTDGTTLRSRLGLNGAITKSIALRALAGFATAFYTDPELDEYQEPVGEVTLTYSFMRQNKLILGYSHDIAPSFTGGWQEFDRGNLELTTVLAGAFSLSAEASVGKYRFGRMVAPDGDALGVDGDQREDIRVDFGLHGEYRVTNYLAFTADFTGQVVSTDFEYVTDVAGTSFVDPADFTVLQVFGGVRAFY